jgi:hypothetical protein
MSSVSGVWQSGKHLVVDTANPVFPNCCVFTNEPIDAKRSPVEIEAEQPSEWRYSLVHGLGHRRAVRTIKLPLAVSPKWDEPRREGKRRVGRIMFRTAFVLGLCSAGAMAWLIQYEGDPTKSQEALVPAIIAIATMPFAFIGTIVGLAWPYLDGVPGAGGAVKAKLTDGRFLWIEGTHPEYLARLPAWPGKSLETSFQPRSTFAETLAKNWPYMLLAFLFWVVIIAAKAYFKMAAMK